MAISDETDERLVALVDRMTWRPIDTAPKTSKAQLVWCPAWRNTYLVSWVVLFGTCAEQGFWSHVAGGRLNERPSHWMPIPAPPTE